MVQQVESETKNHCHLHQAIYVLVLLKHVFAHINMSISLFSRQQKNKSVVNPLDSLTLGKKDEYLNNKFKNMPRGEGHFN